MKKLFFSFYALLLITAFTNDLKAQEKKVRIDVLYFHATSRCQGCITIEENTKMSINSLFGKQLKDSSITLRSIDFLQAENEHFQDDYKFDSQALIISKRIDGKEVKWKNLNKIWEYSSNYDKYQKYIEKEIKKLLNEEKKGKK